MKVRVTLTDGMGRRQIHEDTVVPGERSPGIVAQDLIASLYLRDGDTLSVEFIG
jgi:hypothetical protein